MAILFDAASSASGTTAVTSRTWAHTVGSGSNRLLLVGLALRSVNVSSVTYAGTAMTLVGSKLNGTDVGTYLYHLINPPVGTANVVVTIPAANPLSTGATSWTGVHQTAPLGTVTSAINSVSGPNVGSVGATGEVVVDALAVRQDVNPGLVPNADQTERWDAASFVSPVYISSASSSEPGASNTLMAWDYVVSWATLAVPIKPSADTGVNIAGTSTGTSATTGAVVQGRPITGTATGTSVTRGWVARYPLLPTVIAFRGGPKRLARSMWRATVDNVRVEDITAKVTGASVSMDIDRTIPSTLSVDLIDPSVVRPYSDYLAPTVTITEIVSGTAVTSQVGLYRAGLPSVTRHPKAVVGTVGGEDIVSLLVNSGTGAAPYNLAPGANYMAAAVTQCNLAGVTRVRFPADTRTVPTGKYHSWPPGTARCRIVLDIMLILGYLPPWSDHEGYLVTRVVQDPGAQAPARSYVDGDGSDLTGEVTSDPATTTLANHLVVTYDDITAGTVLTAERTNTDPTSPASIPNIGERFRHEAMTQAADQAAVDAYASQLVEQWGNVLMHLSLTTPLDPLRGWWESADVAIHADRDDGGIVGRFRVNGWEHSLTDGTTAVGLRRNEPFGKAVV